SGELARAKSGDAENRLPHASSLRKAGLESLEGESATTPSGCGFQRPAPASSSMAAAKRGVTASIQGDPVYASRSQMAGFVHVFGLRRSQSHFSDSASTTASATWRGNAPRKTVHPRSTKSLISDGLRGCMRLM